MARVNDGDRTRQQVQKHYARVAEAGGTAKGSCCAKSKCCDNVTAQPIDLRETARRLGYSKADLELLPENVNLGLGCGNPVAVALLKAGETVLDLGSGAGIDCFIAAQKVGPKGHAIGIDMTPEMLRKARSNIGKRKNVEFRLGEIEHLPVADASVDAIISNCVINLSPDKAQVFRDAFRVLKAGGRLAISDIVATAELPEEVRRDLALYTGCMAGASQITELESMLHAAGFEQVGITPKDASRSFIRDWAPGTRIEELVVSANIEAVKP